jgi:hypothetical protein
MRKLLAWVIAVFFVLQSVAAIASPPVLCCEEGCHGPQHCLGMSCSTCLASSAAVVATELTFQAPESESSWSAAEDDLPSSRVSEIWRPPD